MPQPLRPWQKALLYASKILIGCSIAWYGLLALGISNPMWAAITVLLVSDPDFPTARALAITRIINTLLGCAVGLSALLIFGYSPPVFLLTIGVIVLLVTSIPKYPANWRLAPVTVLILFDAGRQAASHADEINYALLRAGEIIAGGALALVLALLYTRLVHRITAPRVPQYMEE